MSDVILYGMPQSTYLRTARMACVEKGVAYDLEPAEFGSETLLALQPFNKIPGFRHGDFTLYETSAICRYIDAAFDGPALQPADVREAARMEQWISAINAYFYPAMIRECVLERVVVPMRGGETDEAKVAAAVPKMAHQLGLVDKALATTPFLAGAAPSLADLFLVPILFWLEKMPEGGKLLPDYPAVGRWYEAMSTRDSFAQTLPPMPQAA
jgi:glutathione S-transferase